MTSKKKQVAKKKPTTLGGWQLRAARLESTIDWLKDRVTKLERESARQLAIRAVVVGQVMAQAKIAEGTKALNAASEKMRLLLLADAAERQPNAGTQTWKHPSGGEVTIRCDGTAPASRKTSLRKS